MGKALAAHLAFRLAKRILLTIAEIDIDKRVATSKPDPATSFVSFPESS